MFSAQIKNLSDIRLSGHVFNTVDENGVVWTITDLDGWWYPPAATVPDNERPYIFDGAYDDDGRYESRLITLSGFFIPLPGAPKYTVEEARERLIKACTLVRRLGLLEVDESTPKIAYVRVSGNVKIGTTKLNGQTSFEVPLKASDPRKYAAMATTAGSPIYTSNQNASGRTYTVPDPDNPNRLTRTYNLVYGASDGSESGQFEIDNIGSYPTYGTVTFRGPVTNPTIENIDSGQKITFERVVGVGETLTIDLQERSVLLNGNTVIKNALGRGSSWFVLEPGVTRFRYTGTQHILPVDPGPATTNFFVDPSFEGTQSDTYYAGTGTSVVTSKDGAPKVGNKAASVKALALNASTAARLGAQGPVTGLPAGTGSLSMSCFYQGYWPPTKRFQCELVQYDSGGAVTSTQTMQAYVDSNFTGTDYPRVFAVASKDSASVTAVGRFFIAGSGSADYVNRIMNPSAEISTNGWVADSVAPERSSLWNYIGNYSFRLYSSSVQNLSIKTSAPSGTAPVTVSSATPYTTSAYFYANQANTSSVSARISIDYYNSSSEYISTSTGASTALSNGIATRVLHTATSPVGAAFAVVTTAVLRPSVISSDTYFVDNVMMNTGTSALTYFDGSTEASARWIGLTHLSTSTLSKIDMSYDAMQIELGPRPTAYFDGDQPDGTWSGDPHASTSNKGVTQYVPKSEVEITTRSAWI